MGSLYNNVFEKSNVVKIETEKQTSQSGIHWFTVIGVSVLFIILSVSK